MLYIARRPKIVLPPLRLVDALVASGGSAFLLPIFEHDENPGENVFLAIRIRSAQAVALAADAIKEREVRGEGEGTERVAGVIKHIGLYSARGGRPYCQPERRPTFSRPGWVKDAAEMKKEDGGYEKSETRKLPAP